MKGWVYFLVIVLANTIGSVSGMGGGVIIKPVLDFFALDSVVAISFYSTVAVFVMSIVSTTRQIQNGIELKWKKVIWLSLGAIIGGVIGSALFEELLRLFSQDTVQLVQIVLTIGTLIFAFLYTRFNWESFELQLSIWYVICGLVLGFTASLLGIGGGPINVSLLMLMFAMPIKDATVYSICTILFSQLSKIVTITLTTGFARYDLSILLFVISAAILGGLIGAKASALFSPRKVVVIFQGVIIIVLLINIYNGVVIYK
uniref:sulfite exporter TauE/SafE family protein n=1 Tax=Candidatus Enterococcus willemsii TaxID=1857215 RepID=UPI00403F6AA3